MDEYGYGAIREDITIKDANEIVEKEISIVIATGVIEKEAKEIFKKNNITVYNISKEKIDTILKELNPENQFFKSEAAKYIYALIECKSGMTRCDLLDIKEDFYGEDIDGLNNWYNNIVQSIQDSNFDENIKRNAFIKISDLYESMIECYSEDDDED
jgi:hypothetical protein